MENVMHYAIHTWCVYLDRASKWQIHSHELNGGFIDILIKPNKNICYRHTINKVSDSIEEYLLESFPILITIFNHLPVWRLNFWRVINLFDQQPQTFILCLTPRTTVMSAHIPDKDAGHRVRNLCAVSRILKGTPGLTHKGCVNLSDVTVVLWMRQSIVMDRWAIPRECIPNSQHFKFASKVWFYAIM